MRLNTMFSIWGAMGLKPHFQRIVQNDCRWISFTTMQWFNQLIIHHCYLFKHIATHILRRLHYHAHMSFLILPHTFNPAHLHFGPIVKNNDSDGNFSRIIYSTKNISFNGVGIIIDLNDTMQEHHCKKTFIRFDPISPTNSNIVRQLQMIETAILEKYIGRVVRDTRQCVHSLSEQLQNGCIKAYTNDASDTEVARNDSNSHVMLKICGVWETKGECGILCKFIKC